MACVSPHIVCAYSLVILNCPASNTLSNLQHIGFDLVYVGARSNFKVQLAAFDQHQRGSFDLKECGHASNDGVQRIKKLAR